MAIIELAYNYFKVKYRTSSCMATMTKDEIHIATFYTKRVDIGRGYGTKVMNQVRAMAIRENKKVTLNVGPFDHATLSITKLCSFYKRFGFKMVNEQKMEFVP